MLRGVRFADGPEHVAENQLHPPREVADLELASELVGERRRGAGYGPDDFHLRVFTLDNVTNWVVPVIRLLASIRGVLADRRPDGIEPVRTLDGGQAVKVLGRDADSVALSGLSIQLPADLELTVEFADQPPEWIALENGQRRLLPDEVGEERFGRHDLAGQAVALDSLDCGFGTGHGAGDRERCSVARHLEGDGVTATRFGVLVGDGNRREAHSTFGDSRESQRILQLGDIPQLVGGFPSIG